MHMYHINYIQIKPVTRNFYKGMIYSYAVKYARNHLSMPEFICINYRSFDESRGANEALLCMGTGASREYEISNCRVFAREADDEVQ